MEKACAFPVVQKGLCAIHLRDAEETGRVFVQNTNLSPAPDSDKTKRIDPSLCFCGRMKGHTGRHIGSPKRSEKVGKLAARADREEFKSQDLPAVQGVTLPIQILKEKAAQLKMGLRQIENAIALLESVKRTDD